MLPLKPIAVAVAVALSMPVALPVHGSGIPVIDVSVLAQQTQQVAHMVSSLANEARMIANQIAQYQEMVRQGMALAEGDWLTLARSIEGLDRIIAEGESIAFTMQDLDSQFRGTFQGYQPSQDWGASYRGWTTRSLDTLRNTLQALGQQHVALGEQDSRLRDLVVLSNQSQGRMQALQAGNRIAATTAQQLMELRQLVAMQTNAQAVYFASQIDKDAAAEAAMQRWVGAPPPPVPVYGTGGGAYGQFPTFGSGQ
ncbi:MAG: P-type conjugative transfer protein TrbJ [Pseudomonadota bacterium]|nr:P-type conjugative transfer protein TrbJ [Pseudomonadota bacterium]